MRINVLTELRLYSELTKWKRVVKNSQTHFKIQKGLALLEPHGN